jgi:hypothetical protein
VDDLATKVPVRASSAAWRRVDGEMVVLQPDAGELVGLNGVGGRVWELIDGVRSVDEIARTVGAEYHDAPPERVAADVVAFVRELAAAKLVEPL